MSAEEHEIGKPVPLAFVKPSKPFGEMTDLELRDWVVALHSSIALDSDESTSHARD